MEMIYKIVYSYLNKDSGSKEEYHIATAIQGGKYVTINISPLYSLEEARYEAQNRANHFKTVHDIYKGNRVGKHGSPLKRGAKLVEKIYPQT